MSIAFNVVIPARYASTRLPGKPLQDIAGLPMVVRVAQQAAACGAAQIVIATDHQAIADAVSAHGYRVALTRSDHQSGTERLAEVVAQQQWDDDSIIVNVQGDEPLIPPALIDAVANHLQQHPEAAIATAAHPIHRREDFNNPNIVKTVLDQQQNALYFSRAPIPWPRELMATDQPLPDSLPILRHIGIYAYRAHFLRAYSQLPATPLEQIEALEQLRALFYGYRIGVHITDSAPPAGVDTEHDLEQVRNFFATQSEKETNR